ncbi:SDR family NAD(P)-dependent oxidoreductase [Actinocrispum wychmicini]|uniref:Short-subunit dehydrogenase n=1 Tax=Actinocrispum wychmicini TaxID=1213861 RepID=A0A4V2S3M6_9PSEU|nr:SDR family NAD(P)-dependent oxidoreductase [Actinocrispum wychmicini]TCO44810.1 hypothetical protein EV192_12267 [Actinocrispum wychmicini]
MATLSAYGPWAVITGASSGIGLEFAEQFAAAGLNLVLAARSTDRLAALGRRLSTAHDIDHRVVTVDLGDPEGATSLVDATEDLDVGLLISNAGTGRPGRFLDQDLSDLHDRLTVNATAHLDLAHAFGRRFVQRGSGAMVLVSALGAMHGVPNLAHESASKAYILHLGEALHHELRPAGVQVTVMLPGPVDTPTLDQFGFDRTRMPMRPQSAAAAVRQTIQGLVAGHATVVPDRRLGIITRLTPHRVYTRMNGRMMGQAAATLAAREARKATPERRP